MKLTALVENTTACGAATAHGLSLYLETPTHRLLFDLGPDETLFTNAAAKHIDLGAVDTVILSHGHHDHGGALERFLSVNSRAKIYVRWGAFLPHYRVMDGVWHYNGIDPALATHPQVVLLDSDTVIDAELSVYAVLGKTTHIPEANRVLYEADAPDRFTHEQSLLLTAEGKTALIMGCGHTGVINILAGAAHRPDFCIGGYHLMNPSTGQCSSKVQLDAVSDAIAHFPETAFYTCHCTGQAAFSYLAARCPNLHYLACGDTLSF